MKFLTFIPFLLPIALSVPMSDLIPAEATTLDLEERQTNGNHACKIVGNNYVNCHYCFNESCSVVKVLSPGQTYNFDCVCTNGQCINGLCSWDHNPIDYCWVFANATDQNCPTYGSNALPQCAFCGK